MNLIKELEIDDLEKVLNQFNSNLREFGLSLRLDYSFEDLEAIIINVLFAKGMIDSTCIELTSEYDEIFYVKKDPFFDSYENNELFKKLLYRVSPNYYTEELWEDFNFGGMGMVFYRYFKRKNKHYFPSTRKGFLKRIGIHESFIDTYYDAIKKDKIEDDNLLDGHDISKRERRRESLVSDVPKVVFKDVIEKINSLFSNYTASNLVKPNENDIYLDYNRWEMNYFVRQCDGKKLLNELLDCDCIVDVLNELEVSLYLCGYDIFLIKYNIYAVLNTCLTEEGGFTIYKTRYGVSSIYDTICVKNTDGSRYSIDLSIPIDTSKKASVVGRAFVGSMLGGSVGGIIGAASAIEKNLKLEDIKNNHTPTFLNVTLKKLKIEINKLYYCGTYRDAIEFLEIEPSPVENFPQVREALLRDLKTCGSLRNMQMANDIKRFIDEESITSFNNKDFKIFLEKKKNERIDKYWLQNSKIKEKLDSEMKQVNIEIESLKAKIDNCKSKWSSIDKWYLERQNQINTEVNRLSKLISDKEKDIEDLSMLSYIFNGKKMKLEIDEIREEYNKECKKVAPEIKNLEDEYNIKIEEVQKIKKFLDDSLNLVLGKYASLNEELTKDRREILINEL